MRHYAHMKHAVLLPALLSAALVSACASTDNRQFAGDDVADGEAVLMTPAQDVGLSKIKIPAYLSEMSNPYMGLPTDCAAIRAEVEKLDGLLGADLDVPEDEDIMRERNQLNAASSAVGSVLIPFRGVVRAVTGAAKNERDARNAYERGLVRRAYLKGRSEERDCTGV